MTNQKDVKWAKLFVYHLMFNVNLTPKQIMELLDISDTALSRIKHNQAKSIQFNKVMNVLQYFKEQEDDKSLATVLSFFQKCGDVNDFVNTKADWLNKNKPF